MPQTATLIIQNSLGVVVSSTALNIGANTIANIPNAGLNSSGGTTSILYEDDDTGVVCDETYTGIVLPDPPVVTADAIDDNETGIYNQGFTGTVATNDVPCSVGNTTWEATGVQSNGSVVSFDDLSGTYVFNPTPNFVGDATFQYNLLCDGTIIDTAVVTITFPPPTADAVNDSFTTPQDTAISEDVSTNDTACSPNSSTTYQLNGTPAPANGGVSTFNPDGTFTYTPNTGFSGVDTFGYDIVCDGTVIDSAEVQITVTATSLPEGNVVLTPTDADSAGVNADFTASTQDGTNPITVGDSLDITFEYLVDGVVTSSSTITGNFGDPVSGGDIATVAAATGITITGGNYEDLNYTHPSIAVPNIAQQSQDNFDGNQLGKQGDYGVRVTVDVTSGGNSSTNSDNDLSTFWYLTFENGVREGEILVDEIYLNEAGSAAYSPAGFNTTVDNAIGPFALSPEITTLEGESQWNPNSGTQSRADNTTVSASIDGNVDTPFTPTIHTGNYINNFAQLADTLTDLAQASASNIGNESPAFSATGGTDPTIFGDDVAGEYLHWNWQNGVQGAEDSWDNIIQYGPTQADVRQWRAQFSFGGTDYNTDEYRMSLEVFRFYF